MSVESYEVSYRPSALAYRMAQWSGARPNWRAAGGSNRGSGIRFFRTAPPHTPYISAFLGRPPRPQAPNLSVFWTGLPAGTPKIYPHRWTAFVRIFRGPLHARRSVLGILTSTLRRLGLPAHPHYSRPRPAAETHLVAINIGVLALAERIHHIAYNSINTTITCRNPSAERIKPWLARATKESLHLLELSRLGLNVLAELANVVARRVVRADVQAGVL